MHRLVYLDPEILQQLRSIPPQHADPDVVKAVRAAIEKLNPEIRQVVRERYFECLSLAEMAGRRGLEEKEMAKSVYEANRQLKLMLADFVGRRWGIKPRGICRICGHPRRAIIEEILRNIKGSESWAKISRLVESAVGERFHPPQVLKAHLKHMSNDDKENI